MGEGKVSEAVLCCNAWLRGERERESQRVGSRNGAGLAAQTPGALVCAYCRVLGPSVLGPPELSPERSRNPPAGRARAGGGIYGPLTIQLTHSRGRPGGRVACCCRHTPCHGGTCPNASDPVHHTLTVHACKEGGAHHPSALEPLAHVKAGVCNAAARGIHVSPCTMGMGMYMAEYGDSDTFDVASAAPSCPLPTPLRAAKGHAAPTACAIQ